MMRRLLAPLGLLATVVTTALACGGASGQDQLVMPPGCEAGVRDCQCQPGEYGTQACRSDGTLGACNCGNLDAAIAVDAPVEGGTCGDFVCNVGETCANCSRDCGVCPACDYAPTCTGAVAIPTMSTALASFNNNGQQVYTSLGTGKAPANTNCLDPKLRMRLRKLTVTYNGQITGTENLYCSIHASDGATSEIAITPLLTGVKDGDVHPFDPTTSLFWGQTALHTTVNNLTISYQCIEATDNSSYTKALQAARDAAIKAGGVAGPYGWAFGLGGVAASVAAALIPAGGDKVWLDVQQTVDATALLDLTNGRIWEIQQNGKSNSVGTRWNYTLEIESWGCADARPSPL